MKKLLLPLLSIIISNAFTISKSETFEIKSPAKIMTTNFNLQIQNKNNDVIIETFNKIIKEVKKSKICEGGKFTINPHYEWIKDKRIFKGYQGYINFIAPNNKKRLEDKAYHYAINYTRYLTKTFNTKCKIKEIHLNNNYTPIYRNMTKSLSIEAPIQKSVTSKLRVNYIFECN